MPTHSGVDIHSGAPKRCGLTPVNKVTGLFSIGIGMMLAPQGEAYPER